MIPILSILPSWGPEWLKADTTENNFRKARSMEGFWHIPPPHTQLLRKLSDAGIRLTETWIQQSAEGVGFVHPGTVAGIGIPLLLGNRQTEDTISETLRAMSGVPGLEQVLGNQKACKVASCWLVPIPTVKMVQKEHTEIERTRELEKAQMGWGGWAWKHSSKPGLSCPAEWAKCGGIYFSETRDRTTGCQGH